MRGTFVNRETTSKLIIESEGLKMNNLSLSSLTKHCKYISLYCTFQTFILSNILSS